MSALAGTIANQGAVLRHALDLDPESAMARLEGAERVWLVGTGTSVILARWADEKLWAGA
ncbi:MAG TPA: hypothetical protein VH299_12875 [Solirubrobacterales bacterium]|jgi:DNA-binding MurR/RpiR family transcriptional regulator|nr:hypothetical protein [Solirubrobacterales bacterium]